MSEDNKKIWSSNLPLEKSVNILTDYMTRSKSKGIKIKTDYQLYNVYILNTYWITNNYTEISKYFKFSKNDTPDINIARETILRLMSACITTHIYKKPNATVKYEPYIFSIPNMNNAGMFSYGVIYTIEEEGKCLSIIVSEWDMNKCLEKTITNPWSKLSVIQNDDLFNISKIKKLAGMDSAKYFQISDWKSFKTYKKLVDDVKEKEQFSFGKLIDFDSKIKDLYLNSGCMWASGIKSWFIPKGSDYINIDNFFKTKK